MAGFQKRNQPPEWLLMAVCGLLNLGTTSAFATQEPVPPDKRNYTLFNPTPTAQMREMSTDHPDKTESPYTVDAGVNLGVTGSVDDLNPFVGVSWCF